MEPANRKRNAPAPSQSCQIIRRRRRQQDYHESTFFSALLSLALSLSLSSPAARHWLAGLADAKEVTKVTGYYGAYRLDDRNGLSKPENIDYTKLTRINYGPFQINELGSIWGTDVNSDPQILVSFRLFERNAFLCNVSVLSLHLFLCFSLVHMIGLLLQMLQSTVTD